MTKPALSIHTSNRLEILVEHLTGIVEAEPLPALEREVIVVQSQGMVRWLTLQLADRLGIAANLSMPFPGSFCRLLAELLFDRPKTAGEASSAMPSLFDRELLTWRTFDRLGKASDVADPQSHPARDVSTTPATYLESDPDQIKRYQLSVRLAGLLEGYQLFRPRMLLEWEAAIGRSTEDQQPSSIAHADWQAGLWRSLAESADEDHLARRMLRLLNRLRGSSISPAGLPRRLSVFGGSTLPPIFLEVIVALARFIPVRVYFLSPTYHFWGDLRSEREAAHIRRRADITSGVTDTAHDSEDHLEAGHPLLAALGRQGRDFFNLLQETDTEGAAWHELELIDPGDDSLLHALQSDVFHLIDRDGTEAPLKRFDPSDDSLTIHACHSPMREMEVLRDQLLATFEADPNLEPSDVLVMVPRIADYSPYVEAVFRVRGEGMPTLPFAIADRVAGEERPAAETILRLLELVGSRVTPRAVIDLLDTVAVRRAFGITAGDVPQLRHWVRDARIRWAMDGAQRAADFAVPEVDANTWQAGLDRLLMGYAAGAEDDLVAGVAPHAGSTAGNTELLGNLTAFIDTLFRHLRSLRNPRPPDAWSRDLRSALEELYQAEAEDEDSALELVLEALEELHQARELASVTEPISLRVVHAHLTRRFTVQGSGGGFLGGRITFCALKPMRTIPFKVICVAGLAEGAFPRRDPSPSFDLMASQPRPGDRSLAEDDRYLFLETVLAASERLILTYEGRSQKDNTPRAPSAVLCELLDYLDRAFATEDGRPAREAVVVEHRLHPFNAAYYGDSDDPRMFSYSRENFLLKDSGRQRPAAMPFVHTSDDLENTSNRAEKGESQTSDEVVIELPELIELWVNPAMHYCRRVLQLRLTEHEGSDDAEPFDIDFLDRYRLSQRLLERRSREQPTGADELELLRAQDELPLAGLGTAHYSRLARRVDDFAATLPRHPPREPILIEIAGDGWRIHGRLEELTDAGILRFRCANLKPKDLVRAWITHVAHAAWAHRYSSDLPLVTHLAGIDQSVRFGPLDDAPGLLESLILGYRAGLRRPLPLFENASHAYAQAARSQESATGNRSKIPPIDAARRAFEGSLFAGDAGNPYVALCFRDLDPLSGNAFARWAEVLWNPLLDHAEEVES